MKKLKEVFSFEIRRAIRAREQSALIGWSAVKIQVQGGTKQLPFYGQSGRCTIERTPNKLDVTR